MFHMSVENIVWLPCLFVGASFIHFRAERKEPTQFGSVSGLEIHNLPFSHSGIVSLHRSEPKEPTLFGSVSGSEIQSICIGRNLGISRQKFHSPLQNETIWGSSVEGDPPNQTTTGRVLVEPFPSCQSDPAEVRTRASGIQSSDATNFTPRGLCYRCNDSDFYCIRICIF